MLVAIVSALVSQAWPCFVSVTGMNYLVTRLDFRPYAEACKGR